jgi:hypothetical protein
MAMGDHVTAAAVNSSAADKAAKLGFKQLAQHHRDTAVHHSNKEAEHERDWKMTRGESVRDLIANLREALEELEEGRDGKRALHIALPGIQTGWVAGKESRPAVTPGVQTFCGLTTEKLQATRPVPQLVEYSAIDPADVHDGYCPKCAKKYAAVADAAKSID